MSTSTLPFSFQSAVILTTSIGLRKSIKMIILYPALVLTPVFSYWTFGDPNGICRRNADQKLKVSFRLTLGNIIITTFGNLGLFLVHFFTKDLSKCFTDNLELHIISATSLVLSWITLIILQNLQKYQNFFCSCFRMAQVFKKTALDPNNPDKLIDLSIYMPLPQDIKMEVHVKHNENNLDSLILEDIRNIPKKMENVASASLFLSEEPKQSKLKSKLFLIEIVL